MPWWWMVTATTKTTLNITTVEIWKANIITQALKNGAVLTKEWSLYPNGKMGSKSFAIAPNDPALQPSYRVNKACFEAALKRVATRIVITRKKDAHGIVCINAQYSLKKDI